MERNRNYHRVDRLDEFFHELNTLKLALHYVGGKCEQIEEAIKRTEYCIDRVIPEFWLFDSLRNLCILEACLEDFDTDRRAEAEFYLNYISNK